MPITFLLIMAHQTQIVIPDSVLPVLYVATITQITWQQKYCVNSA